MEYKSNNNIIFSCKYHVVWCPKYRRKVLVDGVEERLKELIKEIAVKHQAEIIEMEIMPEHVHLLVEVDPQYGIHRLIRQIKDKHPASSGRSTPSSKAGYPHSGRIPTLYQQ